MGTFGQTTPDTTNSSTFGIGNIIFGSKFTSPADCGTITQISAYMQKNGAGTTSAKAQIFSDSGGVPNSLLATSSELTNIGALAWYNFTINYVASANTVYWLVIVASADIMFYAASGNTNQFTWCKGSYASPTWTYPSDPNPWQTQNNTLPWAMDIYATYTAGGSSGNETFGYTTIGGTEGSWGSITLFATKFTSPSDCGTITKVTARIAALTGTIKATACIYADNNGTPAALLATSSEVTGIGTTPSNIDFPLSYVASPNTVYWLGLMASADFDVFSDTGSSNQTAYQHNMTYPTFPNPWSSPSYTNIVITIYATYIAASGYTLTVNSVPTAISITVDGVSGTTSLVKTLAAGSHVISAPQTVSMGTPAVTLTFQHWQDSSTSPTLNINLQANTTVTATYALLVQAIPGSNFQLNQWLLDGGNVGTANPYPAPLDASHTVQATFTGSSAPQQVTLTITVSPSNGGTTTPAVGTHVYNLNDTPSISASANAGYNFAGWQLDGVNVGSANPYTVTMNANHTLTALFSSIGFTPTMRPTLVRKADGSGLWLVFRGSDGNIWYAGYTRASDTWTGIKMVGGPTDLAPAAAMLGNQLWVVKHNADNSLSYGFFNDPNFAQTFSGWYPLTPSLSTTLSPSLTSDGTNLYVCAIRSSDNAVMWSTFSAGVWSAWTQINNGFSDAAPSIAAVAGAIYVSVKSLGTSTIYWVKYSSGSWGSWAQLTGATSYGPTLATDGTNLILIVTGADNNEWYSIWSGSSWGTFIQVTNEQTAEMTGAALLTNNSILELHVSVLANSNLWSIILQNSNGTVLRAWVSIPMVSGGTKLDGISLTLTKWNEDCVTEACQYDAWVNTVAKRKVKVYGIVRTYVIDCVENNVAWANSIANHFEAVSQAGTVIIFSSDEVVRPVNNVSVIVLQVDYTLENIAGQNIRKVTLTLQEV